jgi:hypothetical protein
MSYQNFEDSITDKFGVIIENWPLKNFCSPNDVKSRNEINVLYHAWESGSTCFRRMGNEEWKKWQEDRFQSAMSQMDATAHMDQAEAGATGNTSPADVRSSEPDQQGYTATQPASSTHPDLPALSAPPLPIDPCLLTMSAPPINPDHAAPLRDTSNSSTDMNTSGNGCADDANSSGSHKSARHGTLINFVNTSTVTSSTGATLMIAKKP